MTVELPRWGEAYTWTNVNCCVHNIIVGKLWMEQYGSMEVVNHSTGHRALLTFKPAGWTSKDLHRVEGFIVDKKLVSIFIMDMMLFCCFTFFICYSQQLELITNGHINLATCNLSFEFS